MANIASTPGNPAINQAMVAIQEPGGGFSRLRSAFTGVSRALSGSGVHFEARNFRHSPPKAIEDANIARFCLEVTQPDPPVCELYKRFLIDFAAHEQPAPPLPATLCRLLVELGTEVYISTLATLPEYEPQDALLEDLLGSGLENMLAVRRHPEKLNTAENIDLRFAEDRKTSLRRAGSVAEMKAKFPFSTFLEGLSRHIRSKDREAIDGYLHPSVPGSSRADGAIDQVVAVTSTTIDGKEIREAEQAVINELQDLFRNITPKDNHNFTKAAATGLPYELPESKVVDCIYTGAPMPASVLLQKEDYETLYPRDHESGKVTLPELPPGQTMPTYDMYVMARRADEMRNNSRTGEGVVSANRRPWTVLEEKALLAGIDILQGPQWSQILRLHGNQGTISQALANRSQVQLKDKGRNMKLIFLKGERYLPKNLSSITGDLKSRGPGRHAKDSGEQATGSRRGKRQEDHASPNNALDSGTVQQLSGKTDTSHRATPTLPSPEPNGVRSVSRANSAFVASPKSEPPVTVPRVMPALPSFVALPSAPPQFSQKDASRMGVTASPALPSFVALPPAPPELSQTNTSRTAPTDTSAVTSSTTLADVAETQQTKASRTAPEPAGCVEPPGFQPSVIQAATTVAQFSPGPTTSGALTSSASKIPQVPAQTGEMSALEALRSSWSTPLVATTDIQTSLPKKTRRSRLASSTPRGKRSSHKTTTDTQTLVPNTTLWPRITSSTSHGKRLGHKPTIPSTPAAVAAQARLEQQQLRQKQHYHQEREQPDKIPTNYQPQATAGDFKFQAAVPPVPGLSPAEQHADVE